MPVANVGSIDTHHPDYDKVKDSWEKVRDCLDGEEVIKDKREKYLPRPSGMTGDRKLAYEGYRERAHFPLITSYALSGALGIVITKLPEFNVPKKLEYILETATKDGKTINQLFLNMVIEIFLTGRVPLLIDILPKKREFRFVQYTAESFINWKMDLVKEVRDLKLGVLKEQRSDSDDIYSHDTKDVYRVLTIDNETGKYSTVVYDDAGNEVDESKKSPSFMGKTIDKIPLYLAGSIDNSFNMQPIPLISVANCSVQIYRKEADLANSEYLSCNPTLCIVGASNDEQLPNVVGSSVMIVLPNEAARIFYTQTDTAALSHVKEHISDLYDEAIRHGVAILDARKGVEAAESLRIRQSTQSASIYSVFLAAANAIKEGLIQMCEWANYDEKEVSVDAPNSLTQGIPDAGLLKELVEGYNFGVVALEVIHRYLVYSGLLDQKTGYDEYVDMLKEIEPLNKNMEGDDKLKITDDKGDLLGVDKSKLEKPPADDKKPKAEDK